MVPSSEVWYPFARLQYKQHVWKRGEGNERQNPSTIVFSTLWASLQQFIYVWLKALIKCGNDLAVLQVNVFLWILNHSTKAHQRCVATWGDGRRLQQLPSLATFWCDSLGGMFFFFRKCLQHNCLSVVTYKGRELYNVSSTLRDWYWIHSSTIHQLEQLIDGNTVQRCLSPTALHLHCCWKKTSRLQCSAYSWC